MRTNGAQVHIAHQRLTDSTYTMHDLNLVGCLSSSEEAELLVSAVRINNKDLESIDLSNNTLGLPAVKMLVRTPPPLRGRISPACTPTNRFMGATLPHTCPCQPIVR